METGIQFEWLNEKYVNEAADLVISAYMEEKTAVPFLPYEKEDLCFLRKLITNLFDNGTGIAAVRDEELIGFIAGFEVKELFGKCKGIYSPLYGHGGKKEYRSVLYQELYTRAAEIWVTNACFTHALTFFAHDTETIDLWFRQGFGLRCVDSICESKTIPANNPSDTIIRKVDVLDIPALANIHRQHNMYYENSPLFMPRRNEDPVQDLTYWLKKDNHHLWAAYQDGKPLGYMRIQPEAETFVSKHRDVMNITGAYVLESERKTGIGTMLLGEIQEWLLQNGYTLCGVDFESINITGSRFWNKHFTPYAYNMVRRIDERISI
jgi:GNAT superfamily N-acetyltransferase